MGQKFVPLGQKYALCEISPTDLYYQKTIYIYINVYNVIYIVYVYKYIYINIFNEPTKTSGAKQKSKALSNSAVVAADPLQCLKRKVEWPETLQCQFYPCHCTHHLAHTTVMVLYQ